MSNSLVVLMRHGEADYSGPRKWNAPGWGGDLAPLSEKGITQVEGAVRELQKYNFQLILTSPTTRTLQSAAILSRTLNLELVVEFDLHEWIPCINFTWRTEQDVLSGIEKLKTENEKSSSSLRPSHETLNEVKNRTLEVISQYPTPVLVVCHEVVIWSLTGEQVTKHAGTRVLKSRR